MKYSIYVIFAIALLISCNDTYDGFVTSPIEEDFSSIANPQERWEAYQLKDYVITQGWTCECFPPNICKAYIINNSVNDVDYQIPKDSYYNRTEKDIYDYTKRKALTIDGAFALIEKYKTSAYKIQVEYDPRFGYPTKLFIDIDSFVVDEEIRRSFSDLKRIVN